MRWLHRLSWLWRKHQLTRVLRTLSEYDLAVLKDGLWLGRLSGLLRRLRLHIGHSGPRKNDRLGLLGGGPRGMLSLVLRIWRCTWLWCAGMGWTHLLGVLCLLVLRLLAWFGLNL